MSKRIDYQNSDGSKTVVTVDSENLQRIIQKFRDGKLVSTSIENLPC